MDWMEDVPSFQGHSKRTVNRLQDQFKKYMMGKISAYQMTGIFSASHSRRETWSTPHFLSAFLVVPRPVSADCVARSDSAPCFVTK